MDAFVYNNNILLYGQKPDILFKFVFAKMKIFSHQVLLEIHRPETQRPPLFINLRDMVLYQSLEKGVSAQRSDLDLNANYILSHVPRPAQTPSQMMTPQFTSPQYRAIIQKR